MSLTSIELELVRNSFKVLSRDLETHSQQFYEALFQHDPSLRALFTQDLEQQGMAFMTALGTIVDNLEEDEKNAQRYLDLARLHAARGVRPKHIEPMREALIDTLRSVLGEDFTPTLESAWREAFDQVADQIIK